MEPSSAAPQPLTKARRIWMAILLGSLAAFGPLTIDMYLPSFPSIANDLDTSASLVQLSLTACLLGLAGGQLVIGPVSDMKGRKGPMMISLSAYVAASILCVFAPSIWVLIAARFLQGFSASAGIVISRAVVRDLYTGKELTKFFALLMLVNGLAPILAPVAGGIILELTTWHGVFAILSVIGLFMLITVFTLLPETLTDENRATTGIKKTILTFGDLVKDRTFTGYALAQGLVMAGIFAYVSGTPFVYQGIYGVSAQVFSFLFAINGIGLIIGSQLTGRLAGIIAETKILFTGLLVTTSASLFLMAMIMIEAPLIFIVIPIFFIVSCVGIVTTTCFSLAMESQGHRAGSASALLGLLPFLFGATSAPLTGVAGEHTAVPMGLIILIADLSALSCYLLLVRKKTDK
ncbi:DHA1 family bicyclomycin/chloramphenicol resistance-like MFS transporter [Salibacterium salarium]|uniref:multidrug effflux MFS transporter n=1 Tax=Salibacterium salarium TaxID=284579 RepID=UPI002788EC7E|nr:multidrug effflux MFS transporter [Salibacterium salarium]MDQ0297780.1 DHA1 family bicyclomycin/chloramphenicol resistance-like MFS transporter [Salibacterium salarium]